AAALGYSERAAELRVGAGQDDDRERDGDVCLARCHGCDCLVVILVEQRLRRATKGVRARPATGTLYVPANARSKVRRGVEEVVLLVALSQTRSQGRIARVARDGRVRRRSSRDDGTRRRHAERPALRLPGGSGGLQPAHAGDALCETRDREL